MSRHGSGFVSHYVSHFVAALSPIHSVSRHVLNYASHSSGRSSQGFGFALRFLLVTAWSWLCFLLLPLCLLLGLPLLCEISSLPGFLSPAMSSILHSHHISSWVFHSSCEFLSALIWHGSGLVSHSVSQFVSRYVSHSSVRSCYGIHRGCLPPRFDLLCLPRCPWSFVRSCCDTDRVLSPLMSPFVLCYVSFLRGLVTTWAWHCPSFCLVLFVATWV